MKRLHEKNLSFTLYNLDKWHERPGTDLSPENNKSEIISYENCTSQGSPEKHKKKKNRRYTHTYTHMERERLGFKELAQVMIAEAF